MFLGDFHIHSTFSDGKLTIPEIVDLYGRHGFGAIALTDHICETETIVGRFARYLDKTLTPANFHIYQEILKSEAERAWDQYRMVVIPGFELTKSTLITNNRSAHILGLGVTDFVSANGDVVDLARAIRSQGGLAIAAHPVHTRRIESQTYLLWDRREELAAELDAWEVASGPVLFPEVLHTDLPKIANSDMHTPRQFSSWKTVFTCERTPEAVLEAIRLQEVGYRFVTGDANELRRHHLPWGLGSFLGRGALGNMPGLQTL